MIEHFFTALTHSVMQHWRYKGENRNVGSFLRKELGEALRIGPKKFRKDLTPQSSGSFPPTGIY